MKRERLLKLVTWICLTMACAVLFSVDDSYSQPKPEGVFRLDLGYLGTQVLDPMLASSRTKWFLLLLYDNLVGVDPYTGRLSTDYGLAEGMKMAPDGMAWTFRIRKDVRFHNGDPLTAEDVAFSLNRALLSPKATAEGAATIGPRIKEIVAADPSTVIIRLKEPSPTLDLDLSTLSDVVGFIVPKQYIQKNGDDYFLKHPIGTGPYKFAEQEMSHHIYFEAGDMPHWRVRTPKYKRIEIQYAPELSTRIAKLKTGGVDAISITRDRIEELKNAGYNVFRTVGRSWWLAYWQIWKSDQFVSDVRVRKALNLAIDRKAILDSILLGQAELAPTAPGGKMTIGYNSDLKPYPYDPVTAKKLLVEAGYPNGWEWTLISYPSGGAELGSIAEVVASYWQKNLGIRSKITVMDWPTLSRGWREEKFVNTAHVTAGSDRASISQYSNYLSSQAGLKTVKDPEIDRLLRIAERDLDPQKREEAARKIQLRVYNEYYTGGMFWCGEVWATVKSIRSWNMGLIPSDFNLQDLYALSK